MGFFVSKHQMTRSQSLTLDFLNMELDTSLNLAK